MRYEEIKILQTMDTGQEDALGNPIYEEVVIDALARLTEWTAEDIEVYGRPITSGGRKVLLKPTNTPITTLDKVSIEGNKYSIESVIDLGRWIMLVTKGYHL